MAKATQAFTHGVRPHVWNVSGCGLLNVCTVDALPAFDCHDAISFFQRHPARENDTAHKFLDPMSRTALQIACVMSIAVLFLDHAKRRCQKIKLSHGIVRHGMDKHTSQEHPKQ